MSERLDLARKWLELANEDMLVLTLLHKQGVAFGAVCFHAQQSAEKTLKAYLIYLGVEFPYTHNLSKLIGLASRATPELSQLTETAQFLTPFAVKTRYAFEKPITSTIVEEACRGAQAVWDAVLPFLPAACVPPFPPSGANGE